MKKLSALVVVIFSMFACCTFAENLFSSNPDAIEKAAESVLMLEVFDANDELIATGSGFVAYNNRTLVTNYHVIEGADWMLANSDAGYQYMVTKVLVADEEKDIAICSFMSPTDLQPLEFNLDGELKRAEGIVAIGSPKGITNTVSLGNISALYEDEDVSWIQFTAPISSGSSGGALFDNNGKVIGVTSASYIDAQNINLAVHISEVEQLYYGWDGIERTFEDYDAVLNPTPVPTATLEPTPLPTTQPTTTPNPFATPVPAYDNKEYTLLYLGSRGEQVRKLQQALIRRGYLSGEADGIFGEMTRTAVNIFNEVHGIDSTRNGWALSSTQNLLFNGYPYWYRDDWMGICFDEGALADWEMLEDDKLQIRFQVTSRAKEKTIVAFDLYVYATDIAGKKVYDNNRFFCSTSATIKPGETIYSNAVILPESSRICRVWCGIYEVYYQDGSSYRVPNYWDYKVALYDSSCEIRP